VPFCAFRAWLFRLTFDLGGVGTAYCTFHIAYRILLAVLGCSPQLKAFANQRPIYMHFMWQRLLLFPSLFQLHLLGGRPPTGTATQPQPTTHSEGLGGGREVCQSTFSIAGGVTFTAFYCYFVFLWFFNSNN